MIIFCVPSRVLLNKLLAPSKYHNLVFNLVGKASIYSVHRASHRRESAVVASHELILEDVKEKEVLIVIGVVVAIAVANARHGLFVGGRLFCCRCLVGSYSVYFIVE